MKEHANYAEHCRLLQAVMEADFCLYDTILYLDTHPNCPYGLAYYRQLCAQKDAAHHAYTQAFGPLTAQSVAPCTSWSWCDAPWPWE